MVVNFTLTFEVLSDDNNSFTFFPINEFKKTFIRLLSIVANEIAKESYNLKKDSQWFLLKIQIIQSPLDEKSVAFILKNKENLFVLT